MEKEFHDRYVLDNRENPGRVTAYFEGIIGDFKVPAERKGSASTEASPELKPMKRGPMKKAVKTEVEKNSTGKNDDFEEGKANGEPKGETKNGNVKQNEVKKEEKNKGEEEKKVEENKEDKKEREPATPEQQGTSHRNSDNLTSRVDERKSLDSKFLFRKTVRNEEIESQQDYQAALAKVKKVTERCISLESLQDDMEAEAHARNREIRRLQNEKEDDRAVIAGWKQKYKSLEEICIDAQQELATSEKKVTSLTAKAAQDKVTLAETEAKLKTLQEHSPKRRRVDDGAAPAEAAHPPRVAPADRNPSPQLQAQNRKVDDLIVTDSASLKAQIGRILKERASKKSDGERMLDDYWSHG